MRFINDILLSAPSIVIGLFVYTVCVDAGRRTSPAWPARVALALIVIPVVVRTTEDMLQLVPDSAARGGGGAGRAEVEGDRLQSRYRAARGGIVTGVLLARGAHRRRDRAAAVHRARQPVLVAATWTSRWPACRWSSSSSPMSPSTTGSSSPGPARC
jgi:hypothetical protein